MIVPSFTPFAVLSLAWICFPVPSHAQSAGDELIPIPTVDISTETDRHSFVAHGTGDIYQGHVDTVLLPDGRTMFATWAINHAGFLGPLAKSEDAGKTWSDLIATPENWKEVTVTTPTIHRLVDPQGKARLFVFGGRNFPGRLRQSYSEDGGKTWTPMADTGLKAECPPKSILSFDEGKRLVMWCDRRDPESTAGEDKDPVVWQSESLDGGLTWSPERVVVKVASRWSQPAVIQSPNGKRLLMLLRNNFRGKGQFSTSEDGGKSWSDAKSLSYSLTGHRPVIRFAPDGRLVVVMRDTADDFEKKGRINPTKGHYVAWVGTFEDIVEGRDGQYRIKLLHSHAGWDTGYSGLEVLPDGTFVATTYVKYAEGPEKHSVVATRFKLQETDALLPGIVDGGSLLPEGWDAAVAGDVVMRRLINTSSDRVKGAHDAEFVCVGDRAYVVAEANDEKAGESAGWPFIYATMSIVNLETLAVEKIIDFARGEQVFANKTLPVGACFVPRIIQKDEKTLRCYFTSEDPGKRQSQMWYRDFDIESGEFASTIHKAMLKTAAGIVDFQPKHFHADAAAQGFTKPAVDSGFFIFDSFKRFEGKTYVALNNFGGKQNALALIHPDLETFEILGHFNEPQSQKLSESAVNQLPDGTWMAICRNDGGNYQFTTSDDGRSWAVAKEMPFVPNGANSKPTFDKFGDTYYLGWQEATKIHGVYRSVFNIDISRDGKTWERKYRFETPKSFQYPTFHEHNGTIWLNVTQGDTSSSRKERIMFGKLEDVGEFASQEGKTRIVWPKPPVEAAVMKRGVKLFTDRAYTIDEMPEAVRGLPFLRTSIEKTDVVITKPGTLYALTPTTRPKAASQEIPLKEAGFTKVDVPEVQLFPGVINRVSLYQKEVKKGERLKFRKMVLLVQTEAVEVRDFDPLAEVDARTEKPVIITNPGPEFHDDARPGAMIIGMDRSPRGRIWGCWTGTGDKRDGYFVLATSDDDGESWSNPRLVVGAADPSGKRTRAALVGNLWTDPLGRLWLFFDQTVVGVPGPTGNWYIRCDDPDAATPEWSEPVYIAPGRTLNKPTVLSNGDWLLPVSHWAEKTAWLYESTDQGKNWKPRGNVKFPGWQFDEHMVVELRDGRLWMLARTSGQPHECFSTDQGMTWSEPKPAASIQNVSARFFLRRLASGRILLVKNGPTNKRLKARSHMSAFLSDDDGKTWQGGLLLDERSGVSYPDGFESPDGVIHILYDWNRHTDAEILMAKFREEDILAGKIVSEEAKLRMLASKATGPKPILYNGIELPLEWPPRRLDPNSAEPMPVPYLRKIPRTIPIDLGRQLLVDDFLIEKTTLNRTFHQAQKHPANPVFNAETEDELKRNDVVYLGQGGVFYDPDEKLFKMFYTAGWRGALAMATSPDLKKWTRPDLELHGGNILLPVGSAWGDGQGATAGGDNALWFDAVAKDPKQRIKYLACWTHTSKENLIPGLSHSLQVSDGEHWSRPVRCNISMADYGSFFYNPFRELWVQSIKKDTSRGRSRYYVESKDFLAGADWSNAVYWTGADRLDLPEPATSYPGGGETPQLYSLAAVAYESIMIGMHQIHRGPNNVICSKGKFPKLTDLELGFSRDGFHWDRPDRRGFIRGERNEGAWDRAYLHTTTGVMVVLNDELVFPYCAYSGIESDGGKGMYSGASIGLATLRRDGFASMDGSGELTTRPVKFSGKHLFVNAIGELRAEVIDSKTGQVLATSKPASGDHTKQRIEWNDSADLSQFSGKPVRFRFHLKDGAFYAFWVTPDENGASNGYVGAGGPAFDGVRDIIPTP